jgi:hypothetical protein
MNRECSYAGLPRSRPAFLLPVVFVFVLSLIVVVLLLLPVLVEVPVVLFVVVVLEPIRIVLELQTTSTAAQAPKRQTRTRSLPDIPELLPAAACASFAFLSASSAAVFWLIRVCFHFANDSGVTGVRFGPSLCRSVSRKSSREMTFAFAASSNAFRCALRTKPGGSACRYLQSWPLGHSQNHPNLSKISKAK